MLLGIDVGGTHTDAVVLDTSGLIDWAKVPTDPQDLLGSIDQAVNRVQNALSSGQLSRFALSTTLCANALIQKRVDPVGVLVFAGPGIDPDQQALGDYFEILPGVIDHRGSVVQDLDSKALSAAVQRFVTAGLKSFACVGKFSPRNPRFELQAAQDLSKHSEHVTLGHRLSGELNFPRRIHTAYYNSAVWKTFNVFADAVAEILKRRGLQCPVDMLKADAGTMNFDVARTVPVETVFSGSAASVMGVSALCSTQKDAILLDIGGTTTDVALFAEGNPIVERQGIPLRGRPTLVKGLKTRSVVIGGD
jgi:N-methylhydantoinase A/oxoprolinase/acetone carboxylase beta subunit